MSDPKPNHTTAPVLEVTRGRINGRVFRNVHKGTGRVWYSTTIVRTFVDPKGVPRRADSFGVDDLLPVAEVARQLWHWIGQQAGGDNTNPNLDQYPPLE